MVILLLRETSSDHIRKPLDMQPLTYLNLVIACNKTKIADLVSVHSMD